MWGGVQHGRRRLRLAGLWGRHANPKPREPSCSSAPAGPFLHRSSAVRLLQQALITLVTLPPPPPPPSSRCSKSEQINSDPNSALGSLPYTAPEVLSNTMRHGHQADVWSLGVALYKMCVGLYPFERLEDAADARTAVQVRGASWGAALEGRTGGDLSGCVAAWAGRRAACRGVRMRRFRACCKHTTLDSA